MIKGSGSEGSLEDSLRSYLNPLTKQALASAHSEIRELRIKNAELVKSLEGIGLALADSKATETLLQDERDAAANDNAVAQKAAAELKHQLATQAAALQQAQQERDEQAAQVKALEVQLAQLKGQQRAAKQRLQRLRLL